MAGVRFAYPSGSSASELNSTSKGIGCTLPSIGLLVLFIIVAKGGSGLAVVPSNLTDVTLVHSADVTRGAASGKIRIYSSVTTGLNPGVTATHVGAADAVVLNMFSFRKELTVEAPEVVQAVGLDFADVTSAPFDLSTFFVDTGDIGSFSGTYFYRSAGNMGVFLFGGLNSDPGSLQNDVWLSHQVDGQRVGVTPFTETIGILGPDLTEGLDPSTSTFFGNPFSGAGVAFEIGDAPASAGIGIDLRLLKIGAKELPYQVHSRMLGVRDV